MSARLPSVSSLPLLSPARSAWGGALALLAGVLLLAPAAPVHAQTPSITVRIDGPEFGIRIGTPTPRPPRVVLAPAPVVYVPAPVFPAPPVVWVPRRPPYPPVVVVAPPHRVHHWPHHPRGGRPGWDRDHRHHPGNDRRHGGRVPSHGRTIERVDLHVR